MGFKRIVTNTHRRLRTLQRHKAVCHGHHIVYLIYYGLALLDDHGIKACVVSTLVAFNALHALTGED